MQPVSKTGRSERATVLADIVRIVLEARARRLQQITNELEINSLSLPQEQQTSESEVATWTAMNNPRLLMKSLPHQTR